MTVSARHTKNIYIGDGTTRNWPYTFSLNHEDHIRIVLESPDGKITQICSEYQVDLLEGYVRYPIENEPLARGWKIALLRKTPLAQEMDLVNNGDFFPETIESAFDRDVLVEQEFQEEIDRTVKIPETETNTTKIKSIIDNIAGEGYYDELASRFYENQNNYIKAYTTNDWSEYNRTADAMDVFLNALD